MKYDNLLFKYKVNQSTSMVPFSMGHSGGKGLMGISQ